MNSAPSEASIQSAIIDAFFYRHRIHLYKIDAGAAGMRHGSSSPRQHSGIPAGFPDLLGVVPGSGRALFIECKKPGQKPRKNQVEFLTRFRDTGALAIWADSVESALHQFEQQVA